MVGGHNGAMGTLGDSPQNIAYSLGIFRYLRSLLAAIAPGATSNPAPLKTPRPAGEIPPRRDAGGPSPESVEFPQVASLTEMTAPGLSGSPPDSCESLADWRGRLL